MAINQIKGGVILNYTTIALNNIVGLLYTPYMLRMMGQSEYGLYSIVASVIAYLTIFDFGLGNTVIRYTAKFRTEKDEKKEYNMFGMFIIIYSILGILAFLVGLILYWNIETIFDNGMSQYEIGRAKILMFLMVFNLSITFPFSIYTSIITAYENFIFQKSINIVRIILNTIVMVELLHLGYRAVGMVVVQTIFNLLILGLNFFYCRYKLRIKVLFNNIDWSLLKEVSVYSFWIFLNVIMDRIFWSTGQFVLGATVGTAAVAVFAIAIQLANMYMGFSTAIASVFLPRITGMVVQNMDKKIISDLFIRTGRIQYAVMAFILSGFIVFGQSFITIWAGSDYNKTYIISLFFFIPLTIPLIQNLGITILQARNQMKFRSIVFCFTSLGCLLLQILLSKYWQGVGCAVSVAIALVVGQIVIMNIYYYEKQELDIPQFWKEIIKMSIVPLVVGGGFYVWQIYSPFDSFIKLLVGILGFSIIYIPLFIRFSINQYEKNTLILPILNKIKRV